MRRLLIILTFGWAWICGNAFAAEKRLNNLTTELLKVEDLSDNERTFTFRQERAGWVFLQAWIRGAGTVSVSLDGESESVEQKSDNSKRMERMRFIKAGEHQILVLCKRQGHLKSLVVRAIPELMHCGLGFDPAIKSYGKYDVNFLKNDILPNVNTLIVPAGIQLDPKFAKNWKRQGKKFVGSVGINYQAKTVDDHFKHWTGFLDRAPFLDGIIIDEFIVNQPIKEWMPVITPERQKRFDEERAQYPLFEEAFRKIRADERYKDKLIYAYIGGSGKKLNQEIIGPNFIRGILNTGNRIALERYIFEVSSEQKSKDALKLFVDGIADWVAKEPSVREQMVVTFGLFSMPPGGINKLPNVDYHVWMDQQMHVLANDPTLAGIGGINWWTSLQADEETVRFVGKLYRHYALDGKKARFTKDPLFLTHIQNTDFEKGLVDWTFQAAEQGSIQAKSFPRYGRIEGRYMGLGSPADPEHIGDTFVLMKRSPKGPNSFTQRVQNLERNRLYSLKMLSCDYQDLLQPTKKTKDEAQPFIGQIKLDGVEVYKWKSFREMYPSSPEPKIPVWITYHWIVFRAKNPIAQLTVSDWPAQDNPQTFSQEQTFNFLELQPYWE